MIICVVGDPEDLTSVYLGWLARRRNVTVFELDEAKLGAEWTYGLEDPQGQGWIERDGVLFPFASLSAAFVRFNPQPVLPPKLSLSSDEAVLFIAERRAALHYFLEALPLPVANRPWTGRSNGSKPCQMVELAAAGFRVPRWVASNEEATIKEFAASCPDGAVYKACSGLRSRVRLVTDDVVQRLREGTTPIVAQEYVKGRDVRVHVVGQRTFATEVLCKEVDYRFEPERNEYVPTTEPASIRALCVRAAERAGLLIAGLDFRVSSDGSWFCLEMNPVPTFLPYEISTGQPIGDALLDVLLNQV